MNIIFNSTPEQFTKRIAFLQSKGYKLISRQDGIACMKMLNSPYVVANTEKEAVDGMFVLLKGTGSVPDNIE